jgi:hypothetical protein
MSWFHDVEHHVHSNFARKPDELNELISCVQNFYPNMTPDNVSNLVGELFDKWDDFNVRQPSLASKEITFSLDLIDDIRERMKSGEDINSLRFELLSKTLSLAQADEIVGRAVLSKESLAPLSSRGFMLSLLAELPLGHPDALNICRTEVRALRTPPQKS